MSNLVFDKVLERWQNSEYCSVEELFDAIKSDLKFQDWCGFVDISAQNQSEWFWQVLYFLAPADKYFGLSVFLQRKGYLGDPAGAEYYNSTFLPQIKEAAQTGQPVMGTYVLNLLGSKMRTSFRLHYDRVIIPEKSAERTKRLIVCARLRFSARIPDKEFSLDAIDEKIIDMCVRGETAKTIARHLDISHRTVEHRINAMRKQAGAKTLPELLMIVASNRSSKGSGPTAGEGGEKT